MLALLALNGVVGIAKLMIGRTKPRLHIDLVHASGLSYPSGHASNAILTWGVLAYILYRYSHPEAWHPALMIGISAFITFGVSVVSAFRNTHWISDLLGGLFIGGSLLVMVIAVDRYFPSAKQTR